MNKNTKLLFSFVICAILSFFLKKSVYATTYFSDNFVNLDSWSLVPGNVGNSSFFIEDSTLNGRVVSGGYSYLYPRNDFSGLRDYTVEFDLYGKSGVDFPLHLRISPNKNNYYQIGIRFNEAGWPQDNNNITLHKIVDGNITLLDLYPSTNFPRRFDINQGYWHKIKVILEGSKISVFFDDKQVIEYLDSDPVLFSGGFGFLNWGGNFFGVTHYVLDNFIVRENGNDLERPRVVVMPGLGASWNERAMVFNENVPLNQWKMTPFVKNYDQLISGLEANGLIKNQDYFVWNYDWRKPVAEIVNNFSLYLASVGITGDEKVDLVGHSLGGLVGRIWAQQNSSRVNQLITLGSPHFGSVKAYEAWNGAKVADEFNIQSVAVNVLLQLQKKNHSNLVETIRAYSPSLFDLLPTFSYLRKNGQIVNHPDNQYLKNQNQTVNLIFEKLLTVVGQGFQTKEWINLVDRSIFDKVLGLWEAGKPASYSYADGDGTVLTKSAKFDGDDYQLVNSNHGEIPDKTVNFILEKLGLGKTVAGGVSSNQAGAVFYLGSPARMEVDCKEGILTDVDGWLLVPGKNKDDCRVTIIGQENGVFHLVLGNSFTDDGWSYWEDNIGVGETKIIDVKDINYWYDEMKRQVDGLLVIYPQNKNLLLMKTAVNAKNQNNLIASYFIFRKEKKEFSSVNEMLKVLEKIIDLNKLNPSKSEMAALRTKALSYKNMADKTAQLLLRKKIEPNTWQATNYVMAEELLAKSSYGGYLLAGKLFEIVWK